MPDSVSQILRSGPPGLKKNIAVLGDGFAAADQDSYNAKVAELLLDGVFGHDYFYEDKQAFNIYRVNLISNHSGVSQRVYDEMGTPANGADDVIVSTTLHDTALGYIYSGSWAHCWLEGGANTATRVQNALNTWVPDYDLVLVILNESGFGGCGGGGFQIVTLGSSWAVMAHEFGHGAGGLADEYCQPGTHAGGEPAAVNVTANSNRATLKWRRFVNPLRPVPTGINPNPGNGGCTGYNQGPVPAGWSNSDDAGLFEGAQYRDSGLYRPVVNCRMRGNSPPFCPVCYTSMKEKHHPFTGRNFLRCYAGDFNGDGRDDLLVHNGNSIMIYRSDGAKLDVAFSAVERVPGSWQFQPGDRFHIGDFNGDGRDEVVVFNGTDWAMEYLGLLADDGAGGLRLIARYDDSMPGWQFQARDRFYVADFNGDGHKDLFVSNGRDWAVPYVGMLRSTGTGFQVVRRYDANMPGWQMRSNDRHYVGDFDGNGREDLWVFNGDQWAIPYLGMLRSNVSSLQMARRYDGSMPGWQMRSHDRHTVADFNGDGRKDLYVFNGDDWAVAYLGMLRSTGSALTMQKRYDGNVPGWQMRRHDRHFACDVKGDGREDLFVYNHNDWGPEYLGILISSGTSLKGRWREGWVGEWNLGSVDRFIPCNYEGVAGKRDLFVHNTNWFGMMRAVPTRIVNPLVVTTVRPGAAVAGAEPGGEEAGGNGGGFRDTDVPEFALEPGLEQAEAGGVATAEAVAAAPIPAETALTAPLLAFGDPNLTLQRLYYRWIHNYRYGRNW
ncbi:MAG TPA: M64 family metallopeptidase [Longimicrobiales bacterium]|nr:M64 family metallopeptidase [Longimicrobiales bacterium]